MAHTQTPYNSGFERSMLLCLWISVGAFIVAAVLLPKGFV